MLATVPSLVIFLEARAVEDALRSLGQRCSRALGGGAATAITADAGVDDAVETASISMRVSDAEDSTWT